MPSDGFVLKPPNANAGGAKVPSNNANISNGPADPKTNKWNQERIWIEAIEREMNSVKDWEDKWSFLAEYDQRGNKKEPRRLPDRVNMFSENIPSTAGHQYGYSLKTEQGKQIMNIQRAFGTMHVKKRNADLICYD